MFNFWSAKLGPKSLLMLKYVLLMSLSLTLAACNVHVDIDGIGPVTSGSGNIEERTVEVEEFTRIKLKTSLDVVIELDDEQELVLKADDNLLDNFSFKTVDGELIIDSEGSYTTEHSPRLHIQIANLNALNIMGSGDIKLIGPIKGDSFIAQIHGSGDIELNDLELDELTLKVFGSGDIKADGEVGGLIAQINGSGDMDLASLEAQTADVKINGSGSLEINAEETLRARISGSGDISYRGSPTVDSKVSGSGDIESF